MIAGVTRPENGKFIELTQAFATQAVTGCVMPSRAWNRCCYSLR